MRRGWMGLCMALVVLLLAGCSASKNAGTSDAEEPVTKDIFAMDTYMTLTAYGAQAQEALDAAEQEINRLDALLGTEQKESESRILNESGSEILSEETGTLLERALEISESTKGAFDITVYPLMEAWGFPTQKYRVPAAGKIKKLLRNVGSSQVSYDPDTRLASLPNGVQVDFGGIAKGYTSGKIMDLFRDYDLDGGLVSLGGNVQVMGEKPDQSAWNVAIRDPQETEDSSSYLGLLALQEEKAVITSGGYERYFEQDGRTYHHILDPATGYPADSGLSSVTIVSSDGTLADGLSTALFVMGREKALAYWREHSDQFDTVLVETDGSITVTEGLKEIFSSEQTFTVEKK